LKISGNTASRSSGYSYGVYGAGMFTKQPEGVIYGSDASSTFDVKNTDSCYQFNTDFHNTLLAA
jgi:hypothetical protein